MNSHKNTPSLQPHQLREFLGKISFCHVAQQGLYQTSPTSIETTHQNLISFPKNISTLWILIVCWLTTATIISGLSFFFFFFFFATNRPTQRFNSDHKYKVTQRPSSFFFSSQQATSGLIKKPNRTAFLTFLFSYYGRISLCWHMTEGK